MQDSVYKKLPQMEKENWWYLGRREIIKALLDIYFKGGRNDLKILDAGCGAGSTMDILKKYGQVTGIDIDERMVRYCRERKQKAIKADVSRLPFSNNTFDLVVVLEVLEHLENEEMAIAEIYRVLKLDGLVSISVPAFSFLWGSQDIAALHKHRYSKKELVGKIESSGFSVIRTTYMNFFLFPLITLFCIFKAKFFKLRPNLDSEYFSKFSLLSSFLSSTLKLEDVLFPFLNFPFGVNLICVAQKDGIKR